MKHSPFVSVLKHCCASATKVPSQQVRDLLHTCAATTHIFQTETVVSPIDALLDSLSAVSSPTVFEAILTFLDEVVARCVRQPFKYLDDFTQLAISQIDPSAGPTVVDPVSPVIMTLAEQWKFFAASKDATDEQKLGGAVWLRRFLDACALLGENTAVLGILCERLSNDSTSKKMKDVFLQGKRMMGGSMKIKLQNEPKDVEVSCSGGRALTDKAIVLDTGVFQKEIELLQSGASEASLFKLATALRAAVDVVRAGPEGDNAPKVFTQVCEAIKIRILRLLGKGEDSIDKTKKLVAGDAKTWRVALGQWNGTLQSRCDIFTGIATPFLSYSLVF